jgi:hypothetical protein
MKLILSAALLLPAIATGGSAQRAVGVRGHTTRDGVYVPPYVRTAPNETRTDNWSSKPNINPYTGKAGTADPYAPKPYKPYSSKF